MTPKPGLVDRLNCGSHRDMDMYSFLASAASLYPYFEACVKTGRETADRPAPETFAALRFPGKLAEAGMRKATGGVNTHKGAIFTLGLLCGALGRLDRGRWTEPETLLAEVANQSLYIVGRTTPAINAHLCTSPTLATNPLRDGGCTLHLQFHQLIFRTFQLFLSRQEITRVSPEGGTVKCHHRRSGRAVEARNKLTALPIIGHIFALMGIGTGENKR